MDALEVLAETLERNARDELLLADQLHKLGRSHANGANWREVLLEEEAPGTMQLVSQALACLSRSSGVFRRELVECLREEKVSTPEIARLFGVTHQRISNLTRRPAGRAG